MKDNLNERIKTFYMNNGFDSAGFHLLNSRSAIEKNGIQVFAIRNGGYKICFKNSNIYSQDELNHINNRFTIKVHHGNYQQIMWDVSNCEEIENEKKTEYPNNAYFSCEPLNEEETIELLDLLSENDKKPRGTQKTKKSETTSSVTRLARKST